MRTLPAVFLLLALAASPSPARAQASPDPAPTLIDTPLAARPSHARRTDRRDSVWVSVQVDGFGVVTSAKARAAAPSTLDSAAVDAARWSVFRPAAPGVPGSALVAVAIAPASDEPLAPIDDVVPQALAAERRGEWSSALELWVGALGRVGTHPAYANPWPLFERAIAAARKRTKAGPLPVKYLQTMLRVDGNLERAVSTDANRKVLAQVEPVNEAAPWLASAWRARACAAAGAGEGALAVRALRLWKLASPDSATTARADTALARVAAGDLLHVSNALRR